MRMNDFSKYRGTCERDILVRYLTHPQVEIDPNKDVRHWSLNETGRIRVANLAASDALEGTTRVISSQETKAVETAKPLASALNCWMELRENMHENDRSATGYLPAAAFEQVADLFFASPNVSVRGWETAQAAQTRIIREVGVVLREHQGGDILIVGHGAVGTLLFCALAKVPISRVYDQEPGGGNVFTFTTAQCVPLSGWRPMESMICPDRFPLHTYSSSDTDDWVI